MPLIKSASKAAVGKNIATEMASGNRPRKQAIAIALETQRRAGGGSPKPAKLSKNDMKAAAWRTAKGK